MSTFLEVQPTLENHWRALMLFGRNVASYKFALGKTLLSLRAAPGDIVRMEELATPFARHVCEHLRMSPKQATAQSSRFLDACRKANAGEMSTDELHSTTLTLGFNNVIDAFHRLGPGDIDTRFHIDERRINGGIRLTDQLYRLSEAGSAEELTHETEARWRLVETAWELGLNRSLIEFDDRSEMLTAVRRDGRITVTSCRAALNGYQKGHCFYCFVPISIDRGQMADVDHFFPWSARAHLNGTINGVWNLVLACPSCNRGVAGKSDLIPSLELLHRLHRRNEFLITSHHPLRETLMKQTGGQPSHRISFLQSNYHAAVSHRIATWEPEPLAGATF